MLASHDDDEKEEALRFRFKSMACCGMKSNGDDLTQLATPVNWTGSIKEKRNLFHFKRDGASLGHLSTDVDR